MEGTGSLSQFGRSRYSAGRREVRPQHLPSRADHALQHVLEGGPGPRVQSRTNNDDGQLNGDVGHDDGQRHGQNSDGVQVNVQQYTELLIYGLFQKVRVLAQDGVFVTIEVWSRLWPSTVTGRRSYRNTHALFRDLSKRMDSNSTRRSSVASSVQRVFTARSSRRAGTVVSSRSNAERCTEPRGDSKTRSITPRTPRH